MADATAGSWVMTRTTVRGVGEPGEQRDDAGAGGRVEVAGRFVGEDDIGAAGDGARDGGALPLAAGELTGPMGERGSRPTRSSAAAGGRARWRAGHPAVEQAGGDVVEHAEMFEQVELLEDESDAPGPQTRQRRSLMVRRVGSGDAHAPRVGRSRVPSRFSRVDLPEPDGPVIATASPAVEPQVDAGERGDPGGRRIGLADVVEFQGGASLRGNLDQVTDVRGRAR